MNNKFNIISLIIFFLFINYSFADEKIKRIDKVSKNLRCLICQGQSVYDSQSEFALSIRDLVIKKIEEGPYKEQMIAIDKKWADPEYWLALGQMVDPTTMGYYLNAVDLKFDSNKD